MTVISLAAAREEREPHWAGECVCLACKHGCEALTAYKNEGKFWVKCMACGTDQTEVFYDG